MAAPRLIPALLAVLVAACGGGGRPAATPSPPAATSTADDGPAIPGTKTYAIESISVHTLTWLSAHEVLTVEFPDDTTAAKTPTWLVVDVRTGAVRRVTPPAVAGCAAGTATGPARVRDGVVAYVEHCPSPRRSRVLSYDVATGRTTPLVDAGDIELEHVTVDRDGQPAFVTNVAGSCAGAAPVTGGRVAGGPLPMPGGWDAAAPLRTSDCAALGRVGFPRVDPAGRRVALVGAPAGARTTLYVSPLARWAPKPVGPPLRSPADLAWSRDGKSVYVTSREGDLLGLARIDLATGKAERLYDRSVLSLAMSPDGRRLAVLRPRPTTTSLLVLPV